LILPIPQRASSITDLLFEYWNELSGVGTVVFWVTGMARVGVKVCVGEAVGVSVAPVVAEGATVDAVGFSATGVVVVVVTGEPQPVTTVDNITPNRTTRSKKPVELLLIFIGHLAFLIRDSILKTKPLIGFNNIISGSIFYFTKNVWIERTIT
jgi:hypothetical protein